MVLKCYRLRMFWIGDTSLWSYCLSCRACTWDRCSLSPRCFLGANLDLDLKSSLKWFVCLLSSLYLAYPGHVQATPGLSRFQPKALQANRGQGEQDLYKLINKIHCNSQSVSRGVLRSLSNCCPGSYNAILQFWWRLSKLRYFLTIMPGTWLLQNSNHGLSQVNFIYLFRVILLSL